MLTGLRGVTHSARTMCVAREALRVPALQGPPDSEEEPRRLLRGSAFVSAGAGAQEVGVARTGGRERPPHALAPLSTDETSSGARRARGWQSRTLT